MDVRQDILDFMLHSNSKVMLAIKETHYINGAIYHAAGFDTSIALQSIVSPDVLVLASRTLPEKGVSAVGKVMTPQLFANRRPIHVGPILWMYAYRRNGSVVSLTFLPKKDQEPL